MTVRDGLLKLSTGLCLVLVPACVHTAGDAALDEPLTWWAPTASLQGAMPAPNFGGVAGNPAIKEGPPATAPVSGVQVAPAFPGQPPPAVPEDDQLRPPPTLKELRLREQKEKEQASPDQVQTEVLSPPLVATPRPAPEDPPLIMAVRCLLNKKPAEAVKWLEHYDTGKSSQELLLTVLSLAGRINEGDLNKMNPPEASATVAELERVAERLRPLAEFAIEKMCFCTHIAGFGLYYAWPEDHVFKPREQVQVYVEFRNFAPGQRKQLYGIELDSALEIRRPDAGLVCYVDPRDTHKPYLSLSPRRDFFVNYQFWLPGDLLPGRYTLVVRVTDKPTGRTATKSMEFRVQNSLARGE